MARTFDFLSDNRGSTPLGSKKEKRKVYTKRDLINFRINLKYVCSKDILHSMCICYHCTKLSSHGLIYCNSCGRKCSNMRGMKVKDIMSNIISGPDDSKGIKVFSGLWGDELISGIKVETSNKKYHIYTYTRLDMSMALKELFKMHFRGEDKINANI